MHAHLVFDAGGMLVATHQWGADDHPPGCPLAPPPGGSIVRVSRARHDRVVLARRRAERGADDTERQARWPRRQGRRIVNDLGGLVPAAEMEPDDPIVSPPEPPDPDPDPEPPPPPDPPPPPAPEP